ncbi:sulfurtransferase complex subunit TusC [Halopseudomonas salina]|uniref:Protein TusC n=1 Tax=Halopseudomonas salina TaxID=1323744 RepID=A0ABQ1PSI9_9GAMM|nr:sulfurtransferase complex subunit TusC [Halopseudomonas salina]GGD02422.1 protein TusC [Halopseudomonas salina]
MKSVLIITSRPPTHIAAREALDLALASAAFGVPTGFLFMGDGVLQLRKGQDASLLQQKSLTANLGALDMYGVEDIMVCRHSLAERGMNIKQCSLAADCVDSAQIAVLLEHYSEVVSL